MPRAELAICPSSNEIWIYENCHDPDTTRWRRTHVLAQVRLAHAVTHDSPLSPLSLRSTTCS